MDLLKQELPISLQSKAAEEMKCRLHPSEVAELLLLDSEVTDMFKCIQCLRDEPSLAFKVIQVSSILTQSCDRDLLDLCCVQTTLYKEVKSFVYKSNYLQNKINDCLKEIEAKMHEMFSVIKNEFISKSQQILFKKTQYMKEYYDKCGRKKMQSIIDDINLNREQKQLQLKQLHEKLSTEGKRKKVADILTKLIDLKPQISLNSVDIMKDLVNSLIQKLSQSLSCGQNVQKVITGEVCPSNNNSQSLESKRMGILTEINGTEYIGQIKREKRNGFGAYTFLGGDKYIGQWRDDNFFGVGTYTWFDGKKYIGEWKDKYMNGQGIFTFLNGSKYIGEYKKGKFNGQGTYIFSSGSQYVGMWNDDKQEGQGMYTYQNGDKYVGEWKNNKKNGYGTLTLADGQKYEGEWNDDKRNGHGTSTWPDGNKYIGQWMNNNCNGFGIQIWPCGQQYVGLFKNFKRHGKGTLTLSQDVQKSGLWENDYFLGN